MVAEAAEFEVEGMVEGMVEEEVAGGRSKRHLAGEAASIGGS